MNYEQLRAIIIERMESFEGVEQSRIDYQNPVTRFEAPAEGKWCRLHIETARAVAQGLCAPSARIPGNILIQCFDRGHAQTIALVKLADALVEHFQFWSVPGLLCREAHLVNVGERDGMYQLNVQIYFVAG